jgi:hypothetical protein
MAYLGILPTRYETLGGNTVPETNVSYAYTRVVPISVLTKYHCPNPSSSFPNIVFQGFLMLEFSWHGTPCARMR